MKCYRRSFIEYYNSIAKMRNALDQLNKESTIVVTEGEN